MNTPIYSKEKFVLGPGDHDKIEVSVEGGFTDNSFYVIHELYKDALIIASVDAETNIVEVKNISSSRSFQVEKGDLIGFYSQPVTTVESQVEEAFASVDGKLLCPLCEKTYTNTPQGEKAMRDHMSKIHEVTV
jgi:hypothetical protein